MIQRIGYLGLRDVYFDVRTGAPTASGEQLLRAVNALIDRTGGIAGSWLPLPTKALAELPTENVPDGALSYCTNETGGAVPVFYDLATTSWRRMQDRNVAS